jgi:hypothetical protein
MTLQLSTSRLEEKPIIMKSGYTMPTRRISELYIFETDPPG